MTGNPGNLINQQKPGDIEDGKETLKMEKFWWGGVRVTGYDVG
jgi:hypothetical protein